MTPEDVKRAKDTLEKYRGGREFAVTISYEEWMTETRLGVLAPRSLATQNLDKALNEYHKNKGGERVHVSFVRLRDAFKNWCSAHGNWSASDRNKKSDRYREGMVTELHDQIALLDAYYSVVLMGFPKEWEAANAWKLEQQKMEALFKTQTLEFKEKLWKTNLIDALTTVELPVVSEVVSASKLAHSTKLVTKPEVRGAVDQILGGQSADALFRHLGTGFCERFVHAMENILNLTLGPVLLLKSIIDAAMMVNERLTLERERFDFNPGQGEAAFDCIIRLIDRDLRVTGIQIGEKVASIVAGTFGAAALGGAVTALVDFAVNMQLYAIMAQEMEDGNRLLRSGPYNINLFKASPLLGCYFLVLSPASVWLNYDIRDMLLEDMLGRKKLAGELFDDTIVKWKRAQPVLDKARQLIRASKYALSGTEHLGWEPLWNGYKGEFLGRIFNTRPDQLGFLSMFRPTAPEPAPSGPVFMSLLEHQEWQRKQGISAPNPFEELLRSQKSNEAAFREALKKGLYKPSPFLPVPPHK